MTERLAALIAGDACPAAGVVRRVTEARRTEALPGGRTYGEVQELLYQHLSERFGADEGWVWVRDFTDEWVVFTVERPGEDMATRQANYSIGDDGAVTVAEPVEVEARTSYEPVSAAVQEAVHVDAGRVLESKGTDDAGGRVFAVQVIATGTSKNGVRYPATVLEAAAPLYEGAKAFDHHRTEAELRTSTVAGLVGHYENVAANAVGITADLHVLPSMSHIAEALDASIEAQNRGLPPVVGISHDVQAALTPAVEGGRRIQEATAITAVLSADVVADPSAGGRATRVVAGGLGSDPHPSKEDDMTLKQLIALLRQTKAEDRAALLQEHAAVVEASGFSTDEVLAQAGEPEPDPAPADDEDADDEVKEPVLVTESISAKVLIRAAMADAGLDEGLLPDVVAHLGARFTEAQLGRAVAGYKRILEGVERRGLRPGVPHVEVGAEDFDKLTDKLMKSFEGDFQEGFSGIKEAYFAFHPEAHRTFRSWSDPDLAHSIIREAWGSAPGEGRVSEAINSGTFGQALGNVMNRRMATSYSAATLSTWQRIVSSIRPLSDFRDQRIVRVGGYGELPVVPERAPYQPLSTPDDEEVTYGPQKRGGTEDYSWEAALNDDLQLLVQIPTKLGRSAAKTLNRGVFRLLTANPTIYDGLALFASGHSNTDNPAVLNDAALSAARVKMAKQTGYGDDEQLGTQPRFLIVPPELRTDAIRLTTSAVAIPGSGSVSDLPNVHTDIEAIVVPELTDANDWFLVGDPADIPTIEVGFLNGRRDPELFVQDSPTVGSMFNADIVTWKIRHVWGLAVLDYRGFYRGANA